MLPGFRFLFAAIVLSMSILVFGLGATALLRAAHEQFASNPSWHAAPAANFTQAADARPVLAMLRVEPEQKSDSGPVVGIAAPAESASVAPPPVSVAAPDGPEQMAALEAGGFSFRDYEGLMSEMKKNTLIIDDITHHEIEKLIEIYKPDIIGSGIKDKFVIEKMGVPCKQLHSYDYSGPYAAFTGAANFYREVDRMVNTKIWKFITPPWESQPQLTATLVHPARGHGAKQKAETQAWRKPAAAAPADSTM